MISGKIARVAILAAVFIVLITVRVVVGSRSEYLKGNEFFRAGNYTYAAVHYDRSIRFYTPFNPYVKGSAAKMLETALKQKEAKKDKEALSVYELLRSALYSVRSFYVPFGHVIDEADGNIAEIRQRLAENDPEWKGGIAKPSREEILASLKTDRSPSAAYSVLSIIGFLGWAAAALFFALNVLKRDLFPSKRAVITGIIFFASYILWMLSLYLA